MSVPYTELKKPLPDIAILCRGCLANSGEMKNMNEWGLTEDFYQITDIRVQTCEDISELLCTTCEDMLLKCKSFKQQCAQSNDFLQELLKKTSSTTVIKESDTNLSVGNTISSVVTDKKLQLTIFAPHMESKLYYTCPYNCVETFLKKRNLLSHLSNIHNVDEDFVIESKFYCSITDCPYFVNSNKNKSFTERKFLNQHYNKVHGIKIICEMCKNKFCANAEYNRHLKNCCQLYKCDICNVEYKTNDRLTVHLKRKHPDVHEKYIKDNKNKRKLQQSEQKTKKKIKNDTEYMCDSPKRSFATQTLIETNIKNDVTLPSWQSMKTDGAKTDEISTQTVFEDLLSLKSQTSEDESLFFSETVSLSDIQTQTFPIEFGLSRCNKETLTETQCPDLSIKETQTCFCLYDSPKPNFKLFDSVSSSPSSINLTSSETQTVQVKSNVKSDVWFNSAETQTCFEGSLSKESL